MIKRKSIYNIMKYINNTFVIILLSFLVMFVIVPYILFQLFFLPLHIRYHKGLDIKEVYAFEKKGMNEIICEIHGPVTNYNDYEECPMDLQPHQLLDKNESTIGIRPLGDPDSDIQFGFGGHVILYFRNGKLFRMDNAGS